MTYREAEAAADRQWPGVFLVERMPGRRWRVTLGYDGGPVHVMDAAGRPICHGTCITLAAEQEAGRP